MHKIFFSVGLSLFFMPLAHAAEVPGLPVISPPTVAAPPVAAAPAKPPVAAAPKSAAAAPENDVKTEKEEKHITKTTPELAYKSLMFLSPEVASIAKIEAEYILIKSGKGPVVTATTSETKDVKPVQQDYYFPQFYLSSVVYRNESDWVVWINGEKYAPSSTKSGDTLFIKSVSPKEVIVEWRPDLTEKITLNLPNYPGVIIDKDNRIIDFTLHPNQTFLSYNMKIVEGKRAPVLAPPQEEQGLIEALTGEVGAAVKAATTDAPQPKEQNKEGLPGLLNAYQNIDKK